MLAQLKIITIAGVILLTTACTAVAPKYQAQVSNVDKLSVVTKDVQVSDFKINKKLNSIST